VLNNYFRPLENSYQEGEIQYRLGPFENGTHTLTLKAWDVLNNSSEATISFQVNTGATLHDQQYLQLSEPDAGGGVVCFRS
jgi:hypothetical protein